MALAYLGLFVACVNGVSGNWTHVIEANDVWFLKQVCFSFETRFTDVVNRSAIIIIAPSYVVWPL